MNRARVIIKEIAITKQGEIKNFQIKLPKNVKRIIAVETDVLILSVLDILIPADAGVGAPAPGGEAQAHYLRWTAQKNPVLGKLKLQSMERANIFFEAWLHFMSYDGGMDDRGRIFPVSPYTLNANWYPKKVFAPLETTIVKGFYEDNIGKRLAADLSYTIKVFVWVETQEDSDGVMFDFQNEDSETKNSELIK